MSASTSTVVLYRGLDIRRLTPTVPTADLFATPISCDPSPAWKVTIAHEKVQEDHHGRVVHLFPNRPVPWMLRIALFPVDSAIARNSKTLRLQLLVKMRK